MLRNYIKLALRNLFRYKGYSLINIIGLSLGMAASLIITLFVLHELSYDRFHNNSERIVRVTREWFNDDGTSNLHLARVAPPIGSLLKSDYPDIIEESLRIFGGYDMLFRSDEKVFIESRSFFAEPSFFKVFSYDLLQGNPETALVEPFTVVLSEESAKRYFGDADAMGQMIRFDSPISDDVVPLRVTGIMQNPRDDSHLNVDILASFETIENFFGAEHMKTNWSNNNYLTYLLLHENYDYKDLQAQMPDFIDHHLGEMYSESTERTGLQASDRNALHLQKLTDIHLKSHLSTEAEANGDIKTVWIFSIIALVIILIACINFMNLATARSGRRSKEIGLRKVMGAYRGQIRFQFFGETVIISLISMILALIMVEITLPFFNNFTGKELSIFKDDPLKIILIICGLTIFTGFLAGTYPALYLSSFEPMAVLRKSSRSIGSGVFRKVLVLLQFSVSIALIAGVFIIYSQMRHLQNKDLGFKKDQVIMIQADQQFMEKLDAFRSEALQNPKILSITRSSLIPSDMLLNNMRGRTVDGDEEVPLAFRLAIVEADYDYFETLGIEFTAGRPFMREYGTDDSLAMILNETAVERLGWTAQEAVGRPLIYGGIKGRIVGVTKDFHFESLHNKIVPIIFTIPRQDTYRLTVKIRPENVTETIEEIEAIYASVRPGYPFQYYFLDEIIQDLYEAEQRQGEIIAIFSLLSVVIACLGLFGLASFTAEQRTHEIGVRKVFGASSGSVVNLLAKEFLKWVLLANIIAWPLAWLLMDEWLTGFAYRVPLTIWIFIFSGLLAAAIAMITVSAQAWKASRSNPIDALRYE